MNQRLDQKDEVKRINQRPSCEWVVPSHLLAKIFSFFSLPLSFSSASQHSSCQSLFYPLLPLAFPSLRPKLLFSILDAPSTRRPHPAFSFTPFLLSLPSAPLQAYSLFPGCSLQAQRHVLFPDFPHLIFFTFSSSLAQMPEPFHNIFALPRLHFCLAMIITYSSSTQQLHIANEEL